MKILLASRFDARSINHMKTTNEARRALLLAGLRCGTGGSASRDYSRGLQAIASVTTLQEVGYWVAIVATAAKDLGIDVGQNLRVLETGRTNELLGADMLAILNAAVPAGSGPATAAVR